ncbi:MAG: hypothetical protein Kow00104_04510 [Rhodothalassiaceae bacterium]
MRELDFNPGDVVYSEGDAATAIYLVRDGAIEISRVSGGRPVRLAVLGKGEIFGESGVILDKPHGTTMTALAPSRLLEVTQSEFLKVFGEDNPIGLPLLKMLCSRLEAADARMLAHGKSGPERAMLSRIGAIRCLPDSETVMRQIGEEGFLVTELPFRVGKRALKSQAPLLGPAMLSLHATSEYALSPEHFAFEKRDGHLIVRDMGSHLGTIVNGQHLSRFGQESTAVLHMGTNRISAGTRDSPFSFRIIVEARAGIA